MMTQEVNNPEYKKDNLKPYMLWLLLFTFVAPILAAVWLYKTGGTENTVNRGEFLNPIPQLLDQNLRKIDGAKVTEKDLYGHWHMMFFIANDCVESCEEKIYTMRQIKTSFHKDSERITNVLVHLDENIKSSFQQRIQSHYANFERYFGDTETFNRALGLSGQQIIADHVIYIVDPIGNIILKYSNNKTAKDIISDIKRLLKASQIG